MMEPLTAGAAMSESKPFVPPSRLADDGRIVRAVSLPNGGSTMELWNGKAWIAAPEDSGSSWADLFNDGTQLSNEKLAAHEISVDAVASSASSAAIG